MKPITIAVLASSLLATPTLAQTSSSAQQMLQGLLSGNQGQDQAVRDAFERGYQAGRRDEAQMQASNGSRRNNESGDRGGYGTTRNGGDYPSGRSDSGYNR
ncbi:MAG: hypothetical protein ACJ8AI_25255 [Rhodopila sp.]